MGVGRSDFSVFICFSFCYNKKCMQYFKKNILQLEMECLSIFYVWGHSETTLTGVWRFLTPSSPLVDKLTLCSNVIIWLPLPLLVNVVYEWPIYRLYEIFVQCIHMLIQFWYHSYNSIRKLENSLNVSQS